MMGLVVEPPIEPMLARRAEVIPIGEGYLYEPKWDGFRTLVFRDDDGVLIQSRDLKDMGRYFPELRAPLLAQLPKGTVVDGELVIAGPPPARSLDFDALLARIHPAASRVQRLARETPASFVVFDLLAIDGEDLRKRPFGERHARLLTRLAELAPPLYVTPSTEDPSVALDWFRRFEGAGLDGIVAKRTDLAYEPGKRSMIKVKHERTADCVVGGFRWHKGGEGKRIGSLLLGLYGETGRLEHVGVVATFDTATRTRLVRELAPLRLARGEAHPWVGEQEGEGPLRVPGGPSRWSRGRDLAFVPLRPERVVEVAYDHMQSGRFRHTARFVRWRPDKPPDECTYAQLEVAPPNELAGVFAGELERGRPAHPA